MKDSRRKALTTSFYLINANSRWLERNFMFIQAIFAGTSWVHLNYCRVQSPNVYHVVCPGRFQMIWATMECTVTFEGKLRKNADVSKKFKDGGINSIDEDMLWPDAWKISITVHDLTPNNFNLYAYYYMNGFCKDEIADLSNQKGIVEITKDLGKYIKEITSSASSSISTMVNQTTDVANAVGSAIKNSDTYQTIKNMLQQ